MRRRHRLFFRRLRSRVCHFAAMSLLLSIAGVAVSAQEIRDPDAGQPGKSAPAQTGVRDFAPGVRINWKEHTVEVESRVVLRQGPLELLACSPQTREHESIIAVSARPLHIFQAMGLIGLEAGSPARYDERLDRWFPADGEPLDLRIQWREDGKGRAVAPAAWMVEKKTGNPPEALRWVFSGSLVRKDGRFGADDDGTVVCVVDFDSALIALSAAHSADDAELWLAANSMAVPPTGTRCTLTVRSAYHPKVEVEITSAGVLRSAEESLTARQIGELLSRNRDDRTPFLSLRTHPSLTEPDLARMVRELKDELRRRKIDPEVSMSVRKKDAEPRSRSLPPLLP